MGLFSVMLHQPTFWSLSCIITLQYTATRSHCNTLQHPATPCNTLQHPATLIYNSRVTQESEQGSPMQHTATHCNTLHYTATRRNTLQHTTTHRNTPQHAATLMQQSHVTQEVEQGSQPSALLGYNNTGARAHVVVTDSTEAILMSSWFPDQLCVVR
jgi:hypothetical protein